ncbi:MAG TPA: hypothetical protein V6D47_08155 [Oscillatoriaceae cyanobacterium]
MRPIRRLLSAVVLTGLFSSLVGCGQTGMMVPPMGMTVQNHDWSQIGAFASNHGPRKKKKTSSAVDSVMQNAKVEAEAPAGFALMPDSAQFRQIIESQAERDRQSLAQAILADRDVMNSFENWTDESSSQQVATLKAVGAIEGQIFKFTPPPLKSASGVPSDGTLGYFMPAKRGIGSVTIYPTAIARGDKWQALDVIVHEMRHAYQDQLMLQASNGQLAEGTTGRTLAEAYYQSQLVISKVGGEDNLSYGDYAHLNMEFDSFETGNKVAEMVSRGQADTSHLGYVDTQYDSKGRAQVDLASLESRVGADGLLDAVNQLEAKILK